MKYVLLLFGLFAIQNSFAQGNEGSAMRPSFAAIIVQDLDVSMRWYVEKLEMEVVHQQDLLSGAMRQANLERDQFRLELIQIEKSIAPKEGNPKAYVQGFFKLGFTIDQFDRWIENLTANGTKFKGRVVSDPITGKRTTIILDPDGNRIQLFEK